MKKLLYVVLCLFTIASLTACGGDKNEDKSDVVEESSDRPGGDTTRPDTPEPTPEPNEFLIKLMVDGEEFRSITAKEGSRLDSSSFDSPTKSGYTFAGWDFDFNNVVNSDLEINAKFTANLYKISYENYDGEVVEYSATFDSTYELIVPSREDYEFGGFYLDGEPFTSTGSYTIPNDITLTCKWKKLFNNIVYHLDGATNIDGNSNVIKKDETLVLLPLVKEGYRFDGWYTDSEFTTRAESISYIDGGEDINLYAKFTRYATITYVLNGGVNNDLNPSYITPGATSLLPAYREDSTFRGWYVDPEFTNPLPLIIPDCSGDLTVYARFDSRKYKVTVNFLDKEPEVMEMLYASTFTLPTQEKLGHTLAGYTLGDDLFEANKPYRFEFDDDIVLEPKFSPNTYNITYDYHGGSGANPRTFTYGEAVEIVAPTRLGYEFLGYHVGSLDGELFDNDFNRAEDLVLHAEFKVITYNIFYELDGGTIVGDTIATYTIDDVINLNVRVEKPGYSFAHFKENDREITSISNRTGDITLTAVYTVREYTATVQAMDRTYSFILDYLSEMWFLSYEDFNRKGYEIEGFYAFGEKVNDTIYTFTEDVTLKINYTPIRYKITYELNGGTQNPDNPDFYTVEDEDIRILPATKPGYKLTSWSNCYNSEMLDTSLCQDITLAANYQGNYSYLDIYYNGIPTNQTKTIKNGDTVNYDDFLMPGYTNISYELNGEPFTMEKYLIIAENNIFNIKANPIEYTITYHTNGGSIPSDAPKIITVEKEPLILPAVKDHVGYCRWYRDSECMNLFSYSSFKENPTNIDLYAGYSSSLYLEIIYNLEELNTHVISFDKGDVIEINSEKPGYLFQGFTKDGVEFTPTTFDFDTPITIQANYERIEYKLTYDYAGGAMGTPNPTSYNINYNKSLNAPALRYGYDFDGWYNGETKIVNLRGLTGDMNLVARFTPRVFNITWSNSYEENTNPNTYTVEGLDLVPFEAFAKTFDGFYINDEKVTRLDGTLGDVTIEIRFIMNTYKLTYDFGDGYTQVFDVQYGDWKYPNSTLRPGYIARKFQLDGKDFTRFMLDHDVTVTGVMELEAYRIRYNNVTEEELEKLPQSFTMADELVLPVLYRENSRIKYFTLGGDEIDKISKGTMEELEINANWTNPIKNFIIDLNDGSERIVTPVYDCELNFFKLEDPVREGYIFDRWNCQGCRIDGDRIILYSGTNDAIVTAVYKENTTYTLTFTGHDDETIQSIQVHYGETVRLPRPNVTDGRIFDSWYYSYTYYDDEMVYNYRSNITLSAVYIGSASKWNYKELNGELTLTGYNGQSRHIVIPEILDGKPVVGISANGLFFTSEDAFLAINKLVIGANIKSITGDFLDGQNLESLEIQGAYMNSTMLNGATVKSIKVDNGYDIKGLFNNNVPADINIELSYSGDNNITNLSGLSINLLVVGEGFTELNIDNLATRINHIYLPASLNTITGAIGSDIKAYHAKTLEGFMALDIATRLSTSYYSLYIENKRLFDIEIPEGVTVIKANAFNGLNIGYVHLHDNVTEIGANAFSNSTLFRLFIGSGVTTIGSNILEGSNDLAELYYNGDADGFSAINVDPNNEKLKSVEPIYLVSTSEVITTDSVSYRLVNNTFVYDLKILKSDLRYLDLANGLNGHKFISFSRDAFKYNTLLDYVILPSSFRRANGIKAPSHITFLYQGSEEEWSRNDIKGFSSRVEFNSNITSVTYNSDENYEYYLFNDKFVSISRYVGIKQAVDMLTYFNGKTVVAILPYAFKDRHISSVVIPETVMEIGEYAFSGCTRLTELTLPSSLRAINEGVFKNVQIVELIIPSGIRVIGDYAFSNCAIVNLTLPESVEIIGAHSFESNPLYDFVIPGTIKEIGDEAFKYAKMKSIRIPEGITNLGFNAFQYCNEATEIILPSTITSLGGTSSGQGGRKVEGIYFPSQEVFDRFKDKSSLYLASPNAVAYIGGVALDSITVGKAGATTSFDVSYKNYGGLKTVNILGPVKFGYDVFAGCNNIERINVPDIDTYLACSFFNDRSALTYSGKAYIYVDNVKQEDVVIPSTCKTINTYAFINYPFKSLAIEKGVEIIKANAFRGASLTSLVIPDSVIELGGEAFANSKLESVVVPGSIKNITNMAFEGCKNLSSVTLLEGIEQIGYDVFNNTAVMDLVLPNSCKYMHGDAFGKNIPNSITLGTGYNGYYTEGAQAHPAFTAKYLYVKDGNATYRSKDEAGNELNSIMSIDLAVCYSVATVGNVPASTIEFAYRGDPMVVIYLGTEEGMNSLFTAPFIDEHVVLLGTASIIPEYIDNENYSYVKVGNEVYDLYAKDNTLEVLDFTTMLEGLRIRTISRETFDNNYNIKTLSLPRDLRHISYDFNYRHSVKNIIFNNTEPLKKSYLNLSYSNADFTSQDIIFRNNLNLDSYRCTISILGVATDTLVVPNDVRRADDIDGLYFRTLIAHKDIEYIRLPSVGMNVYFEGTEEGFNQVFENTSSVHGKYFNIDLARFNYVENDKYSYFELGNDIYNLKFNPDSTDLVVDFTTEFAGKTIKSANPEAASTHVVGRHYLFGSNVDFADPTIKLHFDLFNMYYRGTAEEFNTLYGYNDNRCTFIGADGVFEHYVDTSLEYIKILDEHKVIIIKETNGFFDLSKYGNTKKVIVKDPNLMYIYMENYRVQFEREIVPDRFLYVISQATSDYYAKGNIQGDYQNVKALYGVKGPATYHEDHSLRYVTFDTRVAVIGGLPGVTSCDVAFLEGYTLDAVADNAFLNNDTIIRADLSHAKYVGHNAFKNSSLTELVREEGTDIQPTSFEGVVIKKLAASLNLVEQIDISTVEDLTITRCYSSSEPLALDNVKRLTVLDAQRLYAYGYSLEYVNAGTSTIHYALSRPNRIKEVVYQDYVSEYIDNYYTNSLETIRILYEFDGSFSPRKLSLPFGNKLMAIEALGCNLYFDNEYLNRCPNLKYIFLGKTSDTRKLSNGLVNELYGIAMEDIKELENEKFKYALINNKYVIINECKDKMLTSVDLVNEFSGYTLYGIARNAFRGNDKLASIAIPNTVSQIGANAFDGCSALANVVFSENLISIGDDAFRGCPLLNEVVINASTNTLFIGEAFPDLNIKEIYLTGKVDLDYSFRGCGRVEGIEWLGTGVDGIESANLVYRKGKSDMFMSSSSKYLKEAHIVDEFVELNGNFLSLERLTLEGTRIIFSNSFNYSPRLKEVILPEGLERIDYNAFMDCEELVNITIPRTVTTLGNAIFIGCSKLKSVNIPSGITSLPTNLFYDCHSLASITLPDGLTEIKKGVFTNTALTEITIPASVTSIEGYAFKNTNKLPYIVIPEGCVIDNITSSRDMVVVLKSGAKFSSDTYEIDFNIIAEDSKDLVLGETLASGRSATFDTVVTSISHVVNEKYDYILVNDKLVYSLRGLQNIAEYDLYKDFEGKEVKTIAYGGFALDNLRRVSLPLGLDMLKANAFNIRAIEYFNINSLDDYLSIKYMDISIFSEGADLYLNGVRATKLELPEINMNLELPFFNGCKTIRELVIPGTYKEIHDGVADLRYLKKLTLMDGIEVVGPNIFNSSELEALRLPGTLLELPSGLISCSEACLVVIPEGITVVPFMGAKNIAVHQNVTEITSPYFGYDNIIFEGTKIEFENRFSNVKYRNLHTGFKGSYGEMVNDGTFSYIALDNMCIDVKLNAHFIGKVNLIEHFKGKVLKSIGYRGLSQYNSKAIEIPEGVEYIADGALQSSVIEEVILPSTVKNLSSYMLSGVDLKKITINNSDTYTSGDGNNMIYDKVNKTLIYGASGFEIPNDCEVLKPLSIDNRYEGSILIPKSVKVIEEKALRGHAHYEGTKAEFMEVVNRCQDVIFTFSDTVE